MVEAAVRLHQFFKRVLAGVAERRMTEIVGQRERLRQIFIGGERAADRASDLRNLKAVGETSAEKVALMIDEHLRLVFEPAERRGVDDAVAVALEAGAGPAHGARASAKVMIAQYKASQSGTTPPAPHDGRPRRRFDIAVDAAT